jgi:hypothetical protein
MSEEELVADDRVVMSHSFTVRSDEAEAAHMDVDPMPQQMQKNTSIKPNPRPTVPPNSLCQPLNTSTLTQQVSTAIECDTLHGVCVAPQSLFKGA